MPDEPRTEVTHAAPQPRDRRATVLDDAPPPAPADVDHRRLVENYTTIIRERAIRYPVPYHFTRELGRGSQGVVFLAMRQGSRGCLTRHAAKIFDPGIYSSSEKYWTDMGRIAGQVSRLQPLHVDHLVSGDIYNECNGVGYIEMAAIDGIDLQYLLSGTHLAIARSQSTDEEWAHFTDVLFRIQEDTFRFQPGIALYILRRALLGLQVMHEAGFVHGDIKPSNIMIDRLGSVKLVDLGRAVIVGERISILLGSPFYMAPEVHRLEPAQIQSDIYSAGLVCLEMLCGQSLMHALNPTEAELLEYKMSLLNQLEPTLPKYVRENRLFVSILRRMLHPDPSRRYTSAENAEDSSQGIGGIHRQLSRLGLDAEYDRELAHYLEKLSDPTTGSLNPRLDWR